LVKLAEKSLALRTNLKERLKVDISKLDICAGSREKFMIRASKIWV
jgi:hypothetical protein